MGFLIAWLLKIRKRPKRSFVDILFDRGRRLNMTGRLALERSSVRPNSLLTAITGRNGYISAAAVLERLALAPSGFVQALNLAQSVLLLSLLPRLTLAISWCWARAVCSQYRLRGIGLLLCLVAGVSCGKTAQSRCFIQPTSPSGYGDISMTRLGAMRSAPGGTLETLVCQSCMMYIEEVDAQGIGG